MKNTPELLTLPAREVYPMHYAVWCSVGGGEPFGNTIEHASMSEDGKRIVFLLGTHNVIIAEPDELVRHLVADTGGLSPAEREQYKREFKTMLATRPKPDLVEALERLVEKFGALVSEELKDARHFISADDDVAARVHSNLAAAYTVSKRVVLTELDAARKASKP